jgi:hypothetical protein
MDGSALASAGLRDEGRRAGGEGVLIVMAAMEGGVAPRPQREAPVAGARSPHTHHERRRNQR